MKKIGFFLSILALLLPFTTASANDSATIRISESLEGLSLEKSHQSYISYSETKMVDLQGQRVEMSSAAGLCDSPGDVNCQKTGWGVHSVLPACENLNEPYCIESISLEGVKGSLLGYTPGVRILRDPKFPMATGASTSIWKVKDKSGVLNYVSARVVVRSGSVWMNLGKPLFSSFGIELNVVKITDERYLAPTFAQSMDSYGLNQIVLRDTRSQPNCYVEYLGKCAELANKPGQVLSIQTRISDLPATWFTGRMSEALVDISENKEGNRILTVSGKSVEVPEMQIEIPKVELVKNNPFIARGPVGDSYSQTATNALLFFSYLDEKYLQQATGSNVFWSLNATLGAQSGPCFTKYPGVGGVVTTNAMVYNLGTPVVSNGEMIYLIGSTHLNVLGVENRGTYDLVMRSDIARCLYGLKPTPLRAEISVVSDSGQKQIATTSFGEKNGWLHVGAYNFTFSTPKIKLKLTQATKKTTIKCVKGKVMKSVSGEKPVCPTGYKKVG
jgi:hypothetical protein